MPEQDPEINIYKNLKSNNAKTWASMGVTAITIISAFLFGYKVFVYTLNHALTIDKDGDVLPLRWIERNKVIEIEIMDHLADWFGRYYTYDRNNIKTQREAGLWLIRREEGQKLDDFYKSQGWFNEVVKNGLVQKATLEHEHTEITGNDEPFHFKSSAIIEIKNGMVSNHYRLKVTGNIIFVSPKYPENPHGFLIVNYREAPKEPIIIETGN